MKSEAGRVAGLAVLLLAVAVLFGGGLAVSLRHLLPDHQSRPPATTSVTGPVHLLPAISPERPVVSPRPGAGPQGASSAP